MTRCEALLSAEEDRILCLYCEFSLGGSQLLMCRSYCSTSSDTASTHDCPSNWILSADEEMRRHSLTFILRSFVFIPLSTASALWQETHDLNAIQDHVGHRSASSTLVYLRADATAKTQNVIAGMSFGGVL